MAKTTLKIEGVMCAHCEKHVREALERNFRLQSVRVSAAEGLAELESAEPLDEEALRAAVRAAGYGCPAAGRDS